MINELVLVHLLDRIILKLYELSFDEWEKNKELYDNIILQICDVQQRIRDGRTLMIAGGKQQKP